MEPSAHALDRVRKALTLGLIVIPLTMLFDCSICRSATPHFIRPALISSGLVFGALCVTMRWRNPRDADALIAWGAVAGVFVLGLSYAIGARPCALCFLFWAIVASLWFISEPSPSVRRVSQASVVTLLPLLFWITIDPALNTPLKEVFLSSVARDDVGLIVIKPGSIAPLIDGHRVEGRRCSGRHADRAHGPPRSKPALTTGDYARR